MPDNRIATRIRKAATPIADRALDDKLFAVLYEDREALAQLATEVCTFRRRIRKRIRVTSRSDR